MISKSENMVNFGLVWNKNQIRCKKYEKTNIQKCTYKELWPFNPIQGGAWGWGGALQAGRSIYPPTELLKLLWFFYETWHVSSLRYEELNSPPQKKIDAILWWRHQKSLKLSLKKNENHQFLKCTGEPKILFSSV